jgi:transcriptional regulator with XRE-family HTH domain
MRHESGLSQEELGHLAELHRTYVSGIERGVRNPSFVSLEHLLSVLGKQWKDLSELLE